MSVPCKQGMSHAAAGLARLLGASADQVLSYYTAQVSGANFTHNRHQLQMLAITAASCQV